MSFKTKLINKFTESELEIDQILEESYIPLTESDKQNISFEPEFNINDNNIMIIQKFMDFIKEQLELEEIPKINILYTRKEGMTYGSFDLNGNIINVYGKNRGLADIIRTIAHELTHYWQNTLNKIPKDLNGRNLELEAEANTKAGDITYMFGLQNPEIYTISLTSKDA